MYDPVLVLLDGSPLAECVLPHAKAIGHAFDAEVVLLRMLEKNRETQSPQLIDLFNWQIDKSRAALYLNKTKAQFISSGIRTQMIVQEGLVTEGIIEYTQNQGMKLIILSSHGQNGITPWGISSVSQKIILSGSTSVLLIRAQPRIAQPDENPRYTQILVPLDGSQRAEHVLPFITQLAHFYGSELHLAQVVQTPEMARHMPLSTEDRELSARVVSRNREEGERYLEELKSRSQIQGITIHTYLITSERAAAELHRLTEQEDIDLVALTAHGYSGDQDRPYGSMVNNFLHYSKVPLLIDQDLPAHPNPTSYNRQSRKNAAHQ